MNEEIKNTDPRFFENWDREDLNFEASRLNRLLEEKKILNNMVECDYHKKQRITKYWGETSKEQMTWEVAKEWCEKNGGRLPTLIELQQAYADKVDGFVVAGYWSATRVDSTGAYSVNFSDCATNYNSEAIAYYVRCVYERMEFLEKDEVVEK